MNDTFVKSLHQGQHYLKTGIFFVAAMLSFGVFITSIGDFRFAFLFFTLFIPLLVIEFITYHLMTTEIAKDRYVTARMRMGRISIIEMKKEKVGIQFEGIIGKKVYVLKYYTMNQKHEQILENLGRYQVVDLEYYPKSGVIKSFHPVSGE